MMGVGMGMLGCGYRIFLEGSGWDTVRDALLWWKTERFVCWPMQAFIKALLY
jgi:hypothetical protein